MDWLEKLRIIGKRNEIVFRQSDPLTLGVEIELQLIDGQTLNLTPRAEDLLKAAHGHRRIKPEFYLSTLEINTLICRSVKDVELDLRDSMTVLREIARQHDVRLATTGCHPFARYADCVISPTERYKTLIDRNQWLTRRMTVYGLHVHLGMRSGDECIRFNNFFAHFLPHLLALSASSPFWQGVDTGLSSCRPTTYEALPTAGQPYSVRNWYEFECLYRTLRKCGAVESMKDLWWDLRPSPGYGTLEIRVCDGTATLSETLAIVAFIHAMALWFRDHGDWIDRVPLPERWIARENKWRAIRFGLDAELVMNEEGAIKPLRQDVEDWLIKIAPYISEYGYRDYLATLHEVLTLGPSSERQRAVFRREGSLEAVVLHAVRECEAGVPDWSASREVMEAEAASRKMQG